MPEKKTETLREQMWRGWWNGKFEQKKFVKWLRRKEEKEKNINIQTTWANKEPKIVKKRPVIRQRWEEKCLGVHTISLRETGKNV